MTQSELILLNFSETRRRSIKLWTGLPESYYNWKPDEKAMTAAEIIRHVLEADYGWNKIINQESMVNFKMPGENRPFISLSEELKFTETYRHNFLESVRRFSDEELANTEIIHPGNGEKKVLGKYLLRIAYHESVHAGNFISYLRAMNVDRPNIWD